MDNDSPNLFDSEPGLVSLTVSDGHQPADGEANDDVVEYHTDESADENVVEDDGGKEGPAVDQSAERRQRPSEGSDKTKDVPKGLPPGRVKLIMKMDPDVNIVAADAVYLLTKATEGFVALLAEHSHKAMVMSNRKTLQKKHIDTVIEDNVPFEFLEGALDW